jgi:hypothetical protein
VTSVIFSSSDLNFVIHSHLVLTMKIGLASTVIALNVACGGAFVAPGLNIVGRAAPNLVVALHATAADAIATLDASQAATVDKICEAIPVLESKTDLSWTAESIGGYTAKLDGREAPGTNGNVAWLSSLCVQSKLSALTIFNGPLTDVPHLLSRCSVIGDNMLNFVLDFRPRAYGAYEMVDANGNYPGPETLGRAAFAYSGARKDYETKFGNQEVVAFMASTFASFEGGSRSNTEPTELDLLTRGPLYLDVNMPLTDANVAAVAAAREKAAAYWLSWALDDQHAHRPGAPVNTQYVYDTKYKQNCYGALLPIYTKLFGTEDGTKITAADSGPLDEAYVGGGS